MTIVQEQGMATSDELGDWQERYCAGFLFAKSSRIISLLDEESLLDEMKDREGNGRMISFKILPNNVAFGIRVVTKLK
ncbi:hypothetical protein JTE90_013673 [Oedothorax gibbosus]|uniref:Uncharacterized protein n=1 Tax=Oedothorax gibbosus TaxID=931172 RepID=A0AAV6VDE8_9ARAC|nr:hypothetical protein JTE90_013673 [Oedothorax gibbosus]